MKLSSMILISQLKLQNLTLLQNNSKFVAPSLGGWGHKWGAVIVPHSYSTKIANSQTPGTSRFLQTGSEISQINNVSTPASLALRCQSTLPPAPILGVMLPPLELCSFFSP